MAWGKQVLLNLGAWQKAMMPDHIATENQPRWDTEACHPAYAHTVKTEVDAERHTHTHTHTHVLENLIVHTLNVRCIPPKRLDVEPRDPCQHALFIENAHVSACQHKMSTLY